MVNQAGDKVGTLHELMIDLEYGSVAYAVLSFGGFLGMGNRLFAIPWEALKLAPEKKQFILDVDKKKLENAPGFDKDNWPDFADRQWGSTIYKYYGYSSYWDE